jgi:tyrosyl-tRNA synthetase
VHPKTAKEDLAEEITRRFHGAEAAVTARQGFNAVFAKQGIPEDIEIFKVGAGILLVDVLSESGVCSSKGDARRMCKQNAVTIDGRKEDDASFTFVCGEYVLKIGKKRFLKLVVA